MITIELPTEIEESLGKLAEENGMSTEKCIEQAILQYIEDCHDVRLAEAALTEFYASGEKAIPIEEVIKEYGLAR
ncbi:MAG: DUF6290 family protein [Candidatus Symbiobacter sp.]|nr:DUF6290 family protein [Candidatus Symbiobacter sp.]